MKQFWEKLSYTRHIIINPFDGFYEIKFRNRGDASIATLFLLVNGVLAVVSAQYNGFVINTLNVKNMNSILILFYSVIPYLIFVIGNYSTTTLFDGKGTMREIYIVVGYALAPYIVCQVIAVVFSQFIAIEEVPIYRLIFCQAQRGLRSWCSGTDHRSRIRRSENVSRCQSVVAVSIILFLSLLAYSLIQRSSPLSSCS